MGGLGVTWTLLRQNGAGDTFNVGLTGHLYVMCSCSRGPKLLLGSWWGATAENTVARGADSPIKTQSRGQGSYCSSSVCPAPNRVGLGGRTGLECVQAEARPQGLLVTVRHHRLRIWVSRRPSQNGTTFSSEIYLVLQPINCKWTVHFYGNRTKEHFQGRKFHLYASTETAVSYTHLRAHET